VDKIDGLNYDFDLATSGTDMTFAISRRGFLGGLSGLFALPFTGLPPAVASASVSSIAASAPMWAAGTPGEYDWSAFAADTAQDAFVHWCDSKGFPADQRPPFDSDAVMRVKSWDGLANEDITPADWLRGGLGHTCFRCDCETSRSEGGDVFGTEVVCEECTTYAEKIERDEAYGMEVLAELIGDKGEEGARLHISRDEDFSLIPSVAWDRAVAEAALWAA
jgi:hypothetical protein